MKKNYFKDEHDYIAYITKKARRIRMKRLSGREPEVGIF